jgi:hypothetical protein
MVYQTQEVTMALPVKLQYTIRDGKGLVSRTLIHLPSATTLANATTYAQAFASAMDDVISGKVESIDICVGVALPGGLKSDPDADSDIEEGAKFIYEDAVGRIYSQRLPTFLESLILPGTRQVDNTSVDVQAVTDLIVTGNGTQGAVTLADTDITAMISDKEQFVKNRKGRTL